MSVATEPVAGPRDDVNLLSTLKAGLRPLASLQFTVVLFALSLGLVFFGTVAQIDNGIWTVVDGYFWSWVVMIPLELFAKVGHVFFYVPKDVHLGGKFPFPAGKFLALALCVNIVAAHLLRFKFTWKRSGIMILHSGLLLLLAGEVITREASLEQRMIIDEGGSANYASDLRNSELVFGKTLPNGEIEYVGIPQSRLIKGTVISDPALPVDVYVREFFKNADLKRLDKTAEKPAIVTSGIGSVWEVVSEKEVSGVDPNAKFDIPAGYVELRKKGTTESLGVYLISTQFGLMNATDDVTIDGTKYEMTLRPARYYKQYRVELIKFSFDRYIGTNKPKNYSSQIRLIDPEKKIDEEILISMNNPLRHRGEAIFQAGFDDATEKTTFLQVVNNPGWVLPYLSCIIVSLGMFIHFGITLFGFLKKQKARTEGVATGFKKKLPWIAAAIVIVGFLGIVGRTIKVKGDGYDLDNFAKLPVVDGGRVKPLETVARVHLRLMSGREEVKYPDGTTRPAIEWLLDVMTAPVNEPKGRAWDAPVFHIENEHVIGLMGLEKRSGYNYTLKEIAPKFDALNKAAKTAMAKKEQERNLDERKVLETRRKLEYFFGFNQLREPMMLPLDPAKEVWGSLGKARDEFGPEAAMNVLKANYLTVEEVQNLPAEKQKELFEQVEAEVAKKLAAMPAASAWDKMTRAYKSKDPERFNAAVAEYREYLKPLNINRENTWYEWIVDLFGGRSAIEVFLDRTQPLYYVIGFYVFAFLLVLLSFLITEWREPFRKAAFNVLLVTFLIHIAGLAARMLIQGRPPVTNLYSSAIYIGCGCAALGLLLEKIYRNGVGISIGALLGFAGSLVAHNYLGGGEDTLEMMQAVLDTNFWLATHVTCITFGYVATYVSSAAGIAYLIAVLFVRKTTAAGAKDIARMVYAIVCFATLLSFVGTVLGGIWADQSWGRFWGWDPKENGAILLVIWNALILHARWAGLVKDRGIAVLAVLGGIITTWSWFGTNQLQVGLHSYGFSSELAVLCLTVWVALGGIAFIGAIVPRTMWASELRQK
ncbi:cytochrome c biogenesis protein CcsA [soil metagenome]